MMMQNKRLIAIVGIVILLLLIPLIAMQFTDEVSWTLFDFVIASILLLCTGILCEFVLRKIKKTKLKIIICLAILALLFLIWAELAVGIFGTPFSGN